jgi:hypothetical protein
MNGSGAGKPVLVVPDDLVRTGEIRPARTREAALDASELLPQLVARKARCRARPLFPMFDAHGIPRSHHPDR